MKQRLLRWILPTMAALVAAFAPFPTGTSLAGAERVVRVEAGQYAYSPGEVHVAPGDTVQLELVSTDVVHGLYLDGYGVSLEADPGRTVIVRFVADRPGAFRFRCNVTCGAMHPFMIGKLTVGSHQQLLRGAAFTLVAVLGLLFSPRRFDETRVDR